MARYIGAVCRLCRRSGEKLFLKGARCYTPKCAEDKRPRPPGPPLRRRPRLSDRGLQLREKQKARHTYGMLESQFKRFFHEAESKKGITGENLMVMLERRLDNVVYRLGFADSRPQARQIVSHGHILLNGHRADIPALLVKEGDTISWREGSKKTEYFKQFSQTIEAKTVPNWLSVDKESMVGRIVSLPTPEEIGARFEGTAIVEYYSR